VPERDATTTSALTTEQVLERLLAVRRRRSRLEERWADELAAIAVDRRSSGANLLHYAAVRNVDLRAEQEALSLLGLSSLGRSEAHVLATLDAVIRRLADDVGRDLADEVPDLGLRGPDGDHGRLESNASDSLGARSASSSRSSTGGRSRRCRRSSCAPCGTGRWR
jgi:hypothetical protein